MKNYLVIVEFHDFFGIKYTCELKVIASNIEDVNNMAFMIFANEIAKSTKDVYIQRMSITKVKQYNDIKEKFKIN